MKNVYKYNLTMFEAATRQSSLTIPDGTLVSLAKAPCGGKGLPKAFKWVETLDGEFLGMVSTSSLTKVS